MLTEPKRRRFQELRQREDDGTLTPDDQRALALLIQEIEDAEAVYLRPATERLGRECEMLDAKNREREALARRKEALIARLQTMVAEVERECKAIDEEVARVLSEGPHAKTAGKVR